VLVEKITKKKKKKKVICLIMTNPAPKCPKTRLLALSSTAFPQSQKSEAFPVCLKAETDSQKEGGQGPSTPKGPFSLARGQRGTSALSFCTFRPCRKLWAIRFRKRPPQAQAQNHGIMGGGFYYFLVVGVGVFLSFWFCFLYVFLFVCFIPGPFLQLLPSFFLI